MPRGINTTTGPLLKYLNEHRGLQVTLPELEKELGLNANQIRASLTYMRAKRFDIETVVTGQCWIYRAAPPSEVVKEAPAPEVEKAIVVANTPLMSASPVDKPKLTMPKVDRDVEFFQVVSKSEDRVILKDSEGRVYKATEI